MFLLSKLYLKKELYEDSIAKLYYLKSLNLNSKNIEFIKQTIKKYILIYIKKLDQLKLDKEKLDFLNYLYNLDIGNNFYKYLLAKHLFKLKFYDESLYKFEEIDSDYVYIKKVEDYILKIEKKIELKNRFQRAIYLKK